MEFHDIKCKTLTYEPVEAPKYQLCHIIWNVFLFDKEAVKKTEFAEVCRENNIEYVVGIFPGHSELVDTIPSGMAHGLLQYSGHTETLDRPAFDRENFQNRVFEKG